MMNKLHNALTCPVCGTRMTHYRTSGYRCHFERHNEMRRELDREAIEIASRTGKDYDDVRNELIVKRGWRKAEDTE